MKWECEYCDKMFKTKKEFIKHLEEELEIAREEALAAEDDAEDISDKLNELKQK